jgi:hypothetical protein
MPARAASLTRTAVIDTFCGKMKLPRVTGPLTLELASNTVPCSSSTGDALVRTVRDTSGVLACMQKQHASIVTHGWPAQRHATNIPPSMASLSLWHHPLYKYWEHTRVLALCFGGSRAVAGMGRSKALPCTER